MIKEKTEKKEIDIEEKIRNAELALVEFGAEWCSYCMRMKPIVESVSISRPDIEVIEVDIDKAPLMAAKYRIMSVPTFIVVKNGEPCFRRSGIIGKEDLIKAIDNIE